MKWLTRGGQVVTLGAFCRAFRLSTLSRSTGYRKFSEHPKFREWESSYSAKKARELFSSFEEFGGNVQLKKDERSGIARMILDNPAGKNSLTGRMIIQLADIVDDLEKWEGGRAVILEGANGSFCSGGDLRVMKKVANAADGHTMCKFMGDTLWKLRSLPILSIAKVEGYALGGGSELALTCDFRALEKRAKIGYVQAKIGVTPGWGTAVRLFDVVGRVKALEMLALGSVLDAKEAKTAGIANIVFDSETDFDEWVERFVKLDLGVTRAVKQIAAGLERESINDRLTLIERSVFVQRWGCAAHLDALNVGKKHR